MATEKVSRSRISRYHTGKSENSGMIMKRSPTEERELWAQIGTTSLFHDREDVGTELDLNKTDNDYSMQQSAVNGFTDRNLDDSM